MSVNKIFRLSPVLRENWRVAVKSIKSNRLRSSLTIVIIAIGITSLVGVLTAIEALKNQVMDSFEKMGTSSFTICQNYYSRTRSTGGRIINPRRISYYQAINFKEHFELPATLSVYSNISSNITVKYETVSTNPTMSLTAADNNYVECTNNAIEKGRGFTESEMESGAAVAVIGANVSKILFGKEEPIGKIINVSGVRMVVLGVMKEFGTTFSQGADNEVIIPVSCARGYFLSETSSFNIRVVPEEERFDKDLYYTYSENLFRSIRRLSPADKSDFRVSKSDSLLEDLGSITGTITISAMVIGLITLLGAAVGLMNIMLVSVKERTREIGTRKAIGASSKLIKQQFLMESVIISEIGCVAGIIAGISIGNLISLALQVSPFIPWMWILLAVILCLIVGISSGYLPAVRASKLDPIEALRYE